MTMAVSAPSCKRNEREREDIKRNLKEFLGENFNVDWLVGWLVYFTTRLPSLTQYPRPIHLSRHDLCCAEISLSVC